MKKIKVGIIGAGRIGYVHAKSITRSIPQAEVKTVVDLYMNQKIKRWIKEFDIPGCGTDPKMIFEDPEIDAVLICSSTDTHAPLSIAAAQAGKHIFCEKPVAPEIREIKEVLHTVQKNGVQFQTGFNRRFDHNHKAVFDAVQKGKIGDIRMIRITSRDPAPPPLEYIKVSGGLFMDMMIHDFDMARFQTGSEVEEIYAQGNALINPAIQKYRDIDSAIVTLKFKNGILGIIENSREAAYGYDQRLEILGSKGSVQNENDPPSTLILNNTKGVTREKPLYFFLERYMESFTTEKTAFFKAIQKNASPPCTGEDGLEAVRLAKAARKSFEENRPVKLTEIT